MNNGIFEELWLHGFVQSLGLNVTILFLYAVAKLLSRGIILPQ